MREVPNTRSDDEFWQNELRRLLPDVRGALRDAVTYASCPVCHVLARMPFDYFAHLPGRWPGDDRLRSAVCSARGFCRAHTWRLFEVQSLVAIARMLVDILDAVPKEPVPVEACPLCRLQALAENALLDDFCRWLERPGAQEHYLEILGVCYPHFDRLTRMPNAERVREHLVEAQERWREALARDLRSFLAKEGGQTQWQRTEAEKRAPRRALAKLAGGPGL